MSAGKRRSAAIKRNLECPVCFEDYSHTTKIPKSLLCGHTVCADCLKNILSGNHIQCPVCRKHHASTGSIDDLPTNFSVLSMVDSMCQDCRNALKTAQCVPGHCNQELCDPCRDKHLQAFHSDYQQAFSALQAEITQREASCSDSKGIKTMIDGQNKVIKQVNNMCDGFKNRIEKIRTTTILEIKAKVESSTNSFLQWQKNLRKGLDEGKKIVAQSKKLSSINEDLYTRCETLRKELGEKSQQMPSFIDCSLNTSSLSDITTQLPDHLDVLYSTVTHIIGSLNRKRSPVEPVISIEDYISYTGHVVYKGSSKPWDISVSQSTGVIAFTVYNGEALHIMSDQFEALTSYSGEGNAAGKMKHAWGTVISTDNKIFISDRLSHNIHVCDVQGRHLYQIGSEGGGQGQLREPTGLAMDEDDTLFVCDGKNHRICCFTPDGSLIRQFGSKGDREGHFRSGPWFIAASRLHDKVVVSDWYDNFYIFSHGGDHHRTISALTAPCNMRASGVAIDTEGHIIVADVSGHQLLVLDDSLQVVASMGSWGGGPRQLSVPRGVALTARREVLVCDWYNHRLQIFSNNHKDCV